MNDSTSVAGGLRLATAVDVVVLLRLLNGNCYLALSQRDDADDNLLTVLFHKNVAF